MLYCLYSESDQRKLRASFLDGCPLDLCAILLLVFTSTIGNHTGTRLAPYWCLLLPA